jgi:hypothetical protein
MNKENVTCVCVCVCVCVMEYWSSIKNEILSIAGKWMELQIIMLNQISQAEKDKICMFSLICGIYT